jgi:hypothetical protein
LHRWIEPVARARGHVLFEERGLSAGATTNFPTRPGVPEGGTAERRRVADSSTLTEFLPCSFRCVTCGTIPGREAPRRLVNAQLIDHEDVIDVG